MARRGQTRTVMGRKLPRMSGTEAIRVLKRLGFSQVRQRGSHVVLRKSTSEGSFGCVVPVHKELALGTLRGILKQAGISPEDFAEALR